MKDYMELIAKNHPAVEANCEGDTSVYENITFISGSVTQADLDNEYLAFLKQERCKEIDEKTDQLIAQGFSFDGEVFSLSVPAQITWSSLKANIDDFTFPVDVSTLADGAYSLTMANVVPFWGAGMATVKAHLDSGRALKVSIGAAVDEAAVNAIVDNR